RRRGMCLHREAEVFDELAASVAEQRLALGAGSRPIGARRYSIAQLMGGEHPLVPEPGKVGFELSPDRRKKPNCSMTRRLGERGRWLSPARPRVRACRAH